MIKIVFIVIGLCILSDRGFAQPMTPFDSSSTGLVAHDAGLIGNDSADDRPTFSLDGLRMYFGSRRKSKDPWRQSNPIPAWKWDSDLWYRVYAKGVWSAPINVGPPINNGLEQINPTINPRGDILYYVGGQGATVWRADVVNDTFRNPRPVGGIINQAYQNKFNVGYNFMDSLRQIVRIEMLPDSDLFLRAPDAWELHFNEHMINHLQTMGAVHFGQGFSRCESTMTPDGKYAIFSENFGLTGHYGFIGAGDDDLFLAHINERGDWDSIVGQLNVVNTPYAETYPYMAADGVTLYFTSDRPCLTCTAGTSGRQDIYRTRFQNGRWLTPEPLGMPFNSPYDDYGFSISPDGETAYFVSNRTGKSKFYTVRLRAQDSAIAPLQVVILQGRVTDEVTTKPLRAEIFIDDLTKGKNSFSVFSDSLSGDYILAAPRGHRFGVQAVAADHLPKSERFTVPIAGTFDRTKLDLALAPTRVGSIAEFRNVYFNSGKHNLLPESKLELGRVAEFLRTSKATKVEIDGHTDDVGNAEFNNTLSLERARAVLEYLVSQRVPRTQLSARGFGKSKPIALGTDEIARAKNRRVEMVIVQ